MLLIRDIFVRTVTYRTVEGFSAIFQCCYIWCLLDPLYLGSEMDKSSGFGSGIRIRDEQPGSYFRELFFGLQYVKSLMRIRDPGKIGSGIRGSGSEMCKIWIRDKHPGSATMLFCVMMEGSRSGTGRSKIIRIRSW